MHSRVGPVRGIGSPENVVHISTLAIGEQEVLTKWKVLAFIVGTRYWLRAILCFFYCLWGRSPKRTFYSSERARPEPEPWPRPGVALEGLGPAGPTQCYNLVVEHYLQQINSFIHPRTLWTRALQEISSGLEDFLTLCYVVGPLWSRFSPVHGRTYQTEDK